MEKRQTKHEIEVRRNPQAKYNCTKFISILKVIRSLLLLIFVAYQRTLKTQAYILFLFTFVVFKTSMGDRRPFSFRFWSSAQRRNSTTQVTTQSPSPPATTALSPIAPPEPEPRNDSQSTANNTIATSTNPSTAEAENPASQSTTTTANQPTTPPSSEVPTASPTTNATIAASSAPPIVETQTLVDQSTPITSPPASTPPSTTPPSTEVQTASQSTPNALSHPTSEPELEPETSSPSRPTTRSPSSSKPASPSRRTTQSKPPSQPSSPSHANPQARSMPSSPSRVGSRTPSTPQRVSNPRSPPRLPSNSPKQTPPTSKKATQPNSPSNESLSSIQDISNGDEAPPALASKEKESKIGASQEEPQPKEDVKSKNIEPTINNGDKLVVDSNTKPEETKEVKEVVQVANNEAHKEVNDSLTPSSSSIANKPDKMHKKNQEPFNTKDVSINAKPNSQPKNRSMISDTHKDIRGDISRFVNKMAIGDPKRAIYENPVSVITLAGENRGALMEMGPNSSNKDRTVHIHRGYKINPDESAQATTDVDESSKAKKSQHAKATNDQPTEAYVNNNSQGINNSIVFESCVAEKNPGVHMVVNHVHKEPNESIDRARGVETRKAEFNVTRAEKFTYEPSVRRRCLEGLFLETSDSGPENPDKPRRHGCRVGCKNKGK